MDPLVFRLRAFLIIMICVTLVGTLAFMYVEDLGLLDAVYFSLVTITTVGYGDISPATNIGKVLAVFLIISGVGTFTGLVANVTELLLSRREKQQRSLKLNVVVGLFFSEVGLELLHRFAGLDPKKDIQCGDFTLEASCSQQELDRAVRAAQKYTYSIDIDRADLLDIRSFLENNRNQMLRLLEHPALLENEMFTNLLQAIFHLREELVHRRHLDSPSEKDLKHLKADMERVYGLLIHQWLQYMSHLRLHYPYLFLLAVRRNPFSENASADM